MTELLLNNFAAWSAQIAVLIAIGAIAALTLAPGRARLVFWQVLLAIALLLPAMEPWTSRPVQLGDSISLSMSAATVVAAPQSAACVWQREYWLWIAAAGMVFRALWIAVGLARLRWHRLSARPLADPPVPFENLGIRWYVSDTVSGPVTFGWLRPSIVLPSRVCELPADLREAIACHELIHVRRRDWLFVLAEESIRGLFWFHPAVWFALSRIQLAREQAVDSEVVRLLNRDRYLDALMAVASHKLYPIDVAPAPLFLKKRQLAERVSAILKETRMSKSRVIASLATVCSAALIAARVAIFFFPLVRAPRNLWRNFRRMNRASRSIPEESCCTATEYFSERDQRHGDAGGDAQHQWRGNRCACIERSTGSARDGATQRAGLALRCEHGRSAHGSDFDPLRSVVVGPSRHSGPRPARHDREAIATADHRRAHQYYGDRRDAGPGAASPAGHPGARQRLVQR